jgi:hypothetical protein
MIAKRLWGKFPIFFTYTLFVFTTEAAKYALDRSSLFYFYAYWLCEAVGLLLGIGVIFEVFQKLLQPYVALRRTAAVMLSLAVVVLAVMSITVAHGQPTANRSLMAAMLVAEEATRILEIGLLMFLFIFSTAFGLHWRQQAFGITLGLGLYVAVELIGVSTRAHLGFAAAGTFAALRVSAFACSLLVWTGYMLAPERATVSAEMPKRAQLEQWNQAVMELIHQ